MRFSKRCSKSGRAAVSCKKFYVFLEDIPFAVSLSECFQRQAHGAMERDMFLAKGSLFLGRMTQLSDGLSFMLEKNG